jgi:hypothetical protein
MSTPGAGVTRTYRVTTYVIIAWTADFIAENEQDARAQAYDETATDIPSDGYMEQTSRLVEEVEGVPD